MTPNGGREGTCNECPTPEDETWDATTIEECTEYGTSCICRNVGEACYTDFGVWYDILIFSLFALHAYIFYLSWGLAKETWINFRAPGKNGKVKKLNPMDKTLLIVCACQFVRLLFFVTISNGRTDSVLIGPSLLSASFLKIYQTSLSGCFFFMTVVWKQLLDQASTMKKVS